MNVVFGMDLYGTKTYKVNTRILPNAESLCRSNEFFFRVVFFFENLPGEGEGEEENL